MSRSNKKIYLKKSPQDKVIEIFLSAKIDVERYIEKGMDFESVLNMLESRPYRIGDFVIDGLIAPDLWARSHTDEIKIDEKAIEDKSIEEIKAEKLMPVSNFFNLYLGCEKFISYEGKIVYSPDLLKVKKGKLTSKDWEKITFPLDLIKDLQKLRSFAFKNHYLLDISRIGRYGNYPGLYFSANIIDYETDTLMAIVTSMGFFSGDAELFEKIGREIYNFKSESVWEEREKYEI